MDQADLSAPSSEVQRLAAVLVSLRREAALHIQRAFRRHVARFQEMVKGLMKARYSAATAIQRIVRGRYVRKRLPLLKMKNKDRLVRWTKPAKEVMVAGTFTTPPWVRLVKLQYLKMMGVFYTTYLMEAKFESGVHHFRFRVDGVWMCSDLYPKEKDYQGNYSNFISASGEKRLLSRANSAKLLGSEAVGKDFATRPEAVDPIRTPRTWSGILDSPVGKDFREGEERESVPLKMVFSGYMAAHPKSRSAPLTAEGSSDRFFVDGEHQSFGLADGVGEWQTFGLDPGEFPSELMEGCRQGIESRILDLDSSSSSETLQAMISTLHEAKLSTRSFGSSTALLGLIKSNSLHIIYIGDSSFIVLRKREVTMTMTTVYRSMEQQHSFNCPFQLANLPTPEDYPMLLEKGLTSLVAILKKSNTSNQDSAHDAKSEVIELRIGDIIIAGSDGLFDNLYDSDITKIVQTAIESGHEGSILATHLARELVHKAVEKGWDPMYRSPFAKTAQRAGKRYNGGKLDDTTVIVGVAVSVN